MKKVSLSLCAIILFSSVSCSFGMDNDGEGNNAPNPFSLGRLLKSGLIIAGIALAVWAAKEGGQVVIAEECYSTEAGVTCYNYLGDSYDYGECPGEIKEMLKKVETEYDQGTCPMVAGKRGKHPKPRRN